MRRYLLGVDPGKNGGAVALSEYGRLMQALSFAGKTEREISNFFHTFRYVSTSDMCPHIVGQSSFALLEKVASSPQMGVRSAFTFGQGYGFLRGMLTGRAISFDDVTPLKWQRPLGLISRKKLTDTEKKRKNRQKAEQLFPDAAITNATADALLIAYYLKNFYNK